MAKDKFNFGKSSAAQEINEQMNDVQVHSTDASVNSETKEKRTEGKDWVLVQARVPQDLQKRMAVYCAMNRVAKGAFIVDAVREYMDKIDRLQGNK